MNTFGQEPKIKIKDLEILLEKEYESVHLAARIIAKERPQLVKAYAENPHKFDSKRKPRKPKIPWKSYAEELKALGTGNKLSRSYSLLLLKIFKALYGENLLRGKIEVVSHGEVYRYDLNFLNTSTTAFFKVLMNQQVKAGLLMVEAKNYGATDVGNKEFNQSLAYTIKDGRDFIFLVQRDDVTPEDMGKAKTIYLRHRSIVLPLGDSDLIKMIEQRKDSESDFDAFLEERLQQILSA